MSSVAPEKESIGFDAESMGVIADILSTLYSNPQRSVLREYIANAIDAHVIDKVTRPVEVQLPSVRNPNLVVRDYGNGLSEEMMKTVFLRYVNSTKTDRDDQIGALGIGAKSAFAIATSWTVVNVHAGRKYLYVITSNPYGEPTYTAKVKDAETSDLSGITVTVPVSSDHLYHDWKASATELNKWFPENAVKFTIDGYGLDTPHWTASGLSDLHGCIFRPSRYRSDEGMGVVMGGIRYALDHNTQKEVMSRLESSIKEIVKDLEGNNAWSVYEAQKKAQNTYFATFSMEFHRIKHHLDIHNKFLSTIGGGTFHVGLGDIDFMPSRESVKGTPRTIDAIVNRISDTIKELGSTIVSKRSLEPIDRLAYADELTSMTYEPFGTALYALEIPNTVTNIRTGSADKYNTGKGASGMALHNFLRIAFAGEAILVTGITEGKGVYRRLITEKTTGGSVFCVNTIEDIEGFGDIRPMFKSSRASSPIMENSEYRKFTLEISPIASRGGFGSNGPKPIDWYVCDSDEVEAESDQIESVFEFCRSNTDLKVYVVENMASYVLDKYAKSGFRGIVIERGRRKEETFVKGIGREIGTRGQLQVDADKSRVDHAFKVLDGLSDADLQVAYLAMRVDSDYVDNLRKIYISEFGTALLSGHRVGKFIRNVESGREVFTGKVKNAFHILSDDGYDAAAKYAIIRKRIGKVDSRPWVLIPTRSTTYKTVELEQSAMYLAAIG